MLPLSINIFMLTAFLNVLTVRLLPLACLLHMTYSCSFVVTKSLTQELTRIFTFSFHLQINSGTASISVYPPANCLNFFKREILRYVHLVISSLLLATWLHLPLWEQCSVGLFSPLAAYFYCEKKKKTDHPLSSQLSSPCQLGVPPQYSGWWWWWWWRCPYTHPADVARYCRWIRRRRSRKKRERRLRKRNGWWRGGIEWKKSREKLV